jgi:hypothetical protein
MERTNMAQKTTLHAPSDDPVSVPNIITKDLTVEKIACNTPTAIRSGPLLYLSRDLTNPLASLILPVWTSCTATLHRKHMLITWISSSANPSTYVIDLTNCADVRSLSLNQISANEQALLPNKGAGMKVFDIQFEGSHKEKFACASTQERAGWVSAIWYVAVRLLYPAKSFQMPFYFGQGCGIANSRDRSGHGSQANGKSYAPRNSNNCD